MSSKAKSRNKKERFVWGGFHPFSYHPIVFRFISDLRGKTIVDCGCGKGIWGYLIRSTRSLDNSHLVGIDIDKEYLKFCSKHKVYDRLIRADIKKLPLKDGSVDILICSEVIEHLSKKDGIKFLREIDRVGSRGGRAIITTPNMKLDTFITLGKDSHSSRWNVSDFKKMGYKVYGMGIRVSPSFAKWYSPLILAIGYVLSPLSYKIPQIAGFLIAVKDY